MPATTWSIRWRTRSRWRCSSSPTCSTAASTRKPPNASMRRKAAQREARRRLAYAQLKAVQARIDPQLLFDMLDAVRRAYESEPERAERLLDELVAFLRAALPRLQDASSSVPREAETGARAGAAARARRQIRASEWRSSARRRGDGCALSARRAAADAQRRAASSARRTVRADRDTASGRLPGRADRSRRAHRKPPSSGCAAVLADLYGSAAELIVDAKGDGSVAIVKVPYEHA